MFAVDGTIIVVCEVLPSNKVLLNPTVPIVPSSVKLAEFKKALSPIITFV